jgi:hypothetical protein
MHVIYGLGGSGKSQLALNFLHMYRRDYASMFWIEGWTERNDRERLSIDIPALVWSTAAAAGVAHSRRGGDDGLCETVRQGKYEQAEEMHRQALGLRETVLGKEHPPTLMSMSNLALVLSDQGKYEEDKSNAIRTI